MPTSQSPRGTDSVCGALFVYGSLIDPPCLDDVLGHPYTGERRVARLGGFQRIDGAYPYPFIVAADGHSVPGVLLVDLSADDLTVLDRYEEVEAGLYQRQVVEIETLDRATRSARLRAYTYVAGPSLIQSLSAAH